MPKLDLDTIPLSNATDYPPQHATVIRDRWYRCLAPAAGIGDFGFNHVTLKPGAWSSHRHWHEGEDEAVIMLAGEAVLVDNDGEHVMCPGDIAAFPKNDGNGHVLQNRSNTDCVFVVIGGTGDSDCHYPDIDMHFYASIDAQRRKDGSRF